MEQNFKSKLDEVVLLLQQRSHTISDLFTRTKVLRLALARMSVRRQRLRRWGNFYDGVQDSGNRSLKELIEDARLDEIKRLRPRDWHGLSDQEIIDIALLQLRTNLMRNIYGVKKISSGYV